MSNQLTLAPELAGLPAGLKEWATSLLGLADAAGGGISSGGHPRLSLKGRQFSAIDASGDEFRVGNFSQQVGVFVDVVVVGSNPGISKVYYDKPFDPATTEPSAPACFSDNGIGPSARAETPQAMTCASCPHNAWGSKVTPGGAQIKACSDAKKLAVLLTEDIKGPIYELRVPAASLKPFGAVNADLKGRGVPLPMVVLSLTFDQQATYPKLSFKASRYVDGKTELPVVQETLRDRGEEIAEAVGSKDTPNTVPIGVSAAKSAADQPTNVVTMQQPAAEPAKRTRRTKEQMAADAAGQQPVGLGSFGGSAGGSAHVALTGGFDDAPGTLAPTSPTSDAALDSLLSGINFA